MDKGTAVVGQLGIECAEYASGNWVVRPGQEEEFVARWKDFLGWTRESASDLQWAILIKDAGDARHFVSMAGWNSLSALQAWRNHPIFAEKFGACRALCDEFQGSNYRLTAAI